MKQKGGSVTHRGTTYTAQQLLDRVVGTYFERFDMNFRTNPFPLLRKIIDLEGIEKIFDQRENLFLEDDLLTFENIEKRIYYALEKIGRDMQNDPLYKIASPVYNFTVGAQKIDAIRPFLRRSASPNADGTFNWEVFANTPNETTGIIVQATNYQTAIGLACDYHNVVFKGTYEFKSGSSSGYHDAANLEQLKREGHLSRKLVFYTDPSGNLLVYFAEPKNNSGTEYYFHPHNLTKALPQSDKEELLKQVFQQIVQKLTEIRTDCRYKYDVTPERFYHIHVTKIPNEDDILLTLHAMYEDLIEHYKPQSYKDDLLKYSVDLPNGERIKLGREMLPTENLNIGTIQSQNEIWRNHRRAHNAFILLKRDGSHKLYRLTDRNQAGNFFIFSMIRYWEDQLSIDSQTTVALSEQSLGVKMVDINHIRGKGIILSIFDSTNAPCDLFCDVVPPQQQVVKDAAINFIHGASNPVTDAEIQAFVQRSVSNPERVRPAPAPQANNAGINVAMLRMAGISEAEIQQAIRNARQAARAARAAPPPPPANNENAALQEALRQSLLEQANRNARAAAVVPIPAPAPPPPAPARAPEIDILEIVNLLNTRTPVNTIRNSLRNTGYLNDDINNALATAEVIRQTRGGGKQKRVSRKTNSKRSRKH